METVVKGACPHDCPDTCSLLVTVQNEKVIRVAGNPDHPFTDGKLCAKVSKYPERLYHTERLLYPKKRVGPKGSGQFVETSWEEALSAIAERLRHQLQKNPETVLPYSYAGTMGLVQGDSIAARFFHHIGASLLARTICASAGAAGLISVYGAQVGMDWENVVDAKLIIIWGSNSITANLHGWMKILEAKKRGAYVVVIDPFRSDTAEKCDEHYAIQPGTDAALALGLIHLLVENGWCDMDYVAAYTEGFAELAEKAKAFPPERVATITGLTVEQIEHLAHLYATTAQTSPVAIRVNYGVQRARGGGNAVRAIACLPTLVGAWRHPAGGLLLSTSGWFPVQKEALQRPDLLGNRRPQTINMSAIGDALLRKNDYADITPIEMMFVYNSNPVAVAPDSSAVVAGFAREDLMTVVFEHFQTDTADYADWILPATMQMEHLDIHRAYGHMDILLNQPAVAPPGACLPNTEIFRQLARKMGFQEPLLYTSDEELAQLAFNNQHSATADYSYTRLQEQGWLPLSVKKPGWAPFAEGGFFNYGGKCRFVAPELAEKGLDPVPDYIPPYEAGFEDAALVASYPLAMISSPARNFLNSTFVNVRSLQTKDASEPIVWIHPHDAAQREIVQGDIVQVWNDRGQHRVKAWVSDRTKEGVVVVPSIWWLKMTSDGHNANQLTHQRLTDLGEAPTFYDVRVDIKKIDHLGESSGK